MMSRTVYLKIMTCFGWGILLFASLTGSLWADDLPQSRTELINRKFSNSGELIVVSEETPRFRYLAGGDVDVKPGDANIIHISERGLSSNYYHFSVDSPCMYSINVTSSGIRLVLYLSGEGLNINSELNNDFYEAQINQFLEPGDYTVHIHDPDDRREGRVRLDIDCMH